MTLPSPINHPVFKALVECSSFCVTDSGGIQKPVPVAGKLALILPECAMRPEVIRTDEAKLIGTRRKIVGREMLRLIEQPAARTRLSHARSLFGDGQARQHIVRVLLSSRRRFGPV